MDINSQEFARLAKRQQTQPNAGEKGASVLPACSIKAAAISDNPYLGSAENGPYHLGCLLRDNPPVPTNLTEETVSLAEAVKFHAGNGGSSLMHGLAAIGGLMTRVGAQSGEGDLEAVDVLTLGGIIQHLAVELRFMHELERKMEDSLHRQALKLAKEGV